MRGLTLYLPHNFELRVCKNTNLMICSFSKVVWWVEEGTFRDGGAGGAGGALAPPLLRRMTFYFVLVYVVIRENT